MVRIPGASFPHRMDRIAAGRQAARESVPTEDLMRGTLRATLDFKGVFPDSVILEDLSGERREYEIVPRTTQETWAQLGRRWAEFLAPIRDALRRLR